MAYYYHGKSGTIVVVVVVLPLQNGNSSENFPQRIATKQFLRRILRLSYTRMEKRFYHGLLLFS